MNYQREIGLPYPQPWEWIKDNIEFENENPFFVDIGANDGLTCSNTAYFEIDLGWDGICIEPHPEAFIKLKAARKSKFYNCCISNEEKEIDFLVVKGYAEMLSGIFNDYDPLHIKRINDELQVNGGSKEIIKIESKTLSSILEESGINNVDYLSIDTEGSELNVLKGIDFGKFNINIISVENNGYNDNVKNYLESCNYEFLCKVCGDEIYAKLKIQ